MALAVLQYRGREKGHYVFQADIGTARYFRYLLGEKKHKLRLSKNEYVNVLSGHKNVSRLFQINEALHKINRSNFPLRIPENEITDTIKYVQLYSFNNKKVKAPTVSNIIRLYPLTKRRDVTNYGLSLEQTNYNKNETRMQDLVVKNKAFKYREPQYSNVMFWNAIVSALPGLIKYAAPLLGALLNKKQGTSPQNNAPVNNLSSDAINQIVEVLKAIAAKTNQPMSKSEEFDEMIATQSIDSFSSAYTLPPEILIGLGPILEKILSPEAILAIGDEPQKLFKALKDAVQKTESANSSKKGISALMLKSKAQQLQNEPQLASGSKIYSEAKIAPALLAALPALMPLLKKIIDPKTIEAIGNQPIKIFQAIGDIVLKMDAQELQHLENINPGIDTADDISKLLQGMSISSSFNSYNDSKFKLIKNLNMEFVNTKTVAFKNKNRILYSKNQRVVIPFKITTDSGGPLSKVLKKSKIQLLIKDADTMKIVFRKNINLLNIDMSQEIVEAYLTPEETKQIPCNTELKLDVSYIWKSNNNENIGVFKSHYIHFISSYIFDRIGERIGELIPFNDISLHRHYWHKVWEGGFSKSKRWQVEFDVKYFYLLNTAESDLSRLETRKLIVSDNVEVGEEHPNRRKVHAKIKSGTEFGLKMLNNTLTLLNQDLLNEEQLRVLKLSKIANEYHQVARLRVEMKGKEGDTSTLWTYPEMALHKLHLLKVGEVDTYGQVTVIESIEKVIPKPDSIHFIGTTSER